MNSIDKAILEATTPQEISDALDAVRYEAVATDKPHARKVAEPATEPEVYTRTENIGGRDMVFEAGSELELERMVGNAYKIATAIQKLTPQVEAEPRPDPGAMAIAKVELEMQFKRGEITAQDYLAKSGAVKDYLESQGVPIQELRAAVEEKRSKGDEQSWADATQEFLHSAAGADWPGGAQNLEIIGLKLASLGLTDAKDKVGAFAQAWNDMKNSNTFFPYEAPDGGETKHATQSTRSESQSQPVRQAAHQQRQVPKTPQQSSALFGTSSGPSQSWNGPTEAPAKMTISKDATPQDIIQAWKENNIARGIDPNAAFTEAFAKR